MTDQKNFNAILDDFHDYLLGILGHYKNLIPILKDELNSILSDNVEALDENLKSQQVLLIQTKTFNKQVNDFSAKLNISAKNLTEMALQLKKEDQIRFFGLLGDFENTMTEVNFYKEKCRVLLQSKLYVIEKILSSQDAQRDNTTYDRNASEVQGGLFAKSFEQKI